MNFSRVSSQGSENHALHFEIALTNNFSGVWNLKKIFSKIFEVLLHKFQTKTLKISFETILTIGPTLYMSKTEMGQPLPSKPQVGTASGTSPSRDAHSRALAFRRVTFSKKNFSRVGLDEILRRFQFRKIFDSLRNSESLKKFFFRNFAVKIYRKVFPRFFNDSKSYG